MPFADVAFAAGFASIRQFNDTVREVYAGTPDRAARTVPSAPSTTPGRIDAAAAGAGAVRRERGAAFLAAHLVPGVEESGPDWYARTLTLPHGARPRAAGVPAPTSRTPGGRPSCAASSAVHDLRDVGAAVERCRRLLDADCDPVAVGDGLSDDPRMAALVRPRPGLRVPGSVDGDEIAIRAVIGQQISLAGAISLGGKLVARYGADAAGGSTYDGPGRLFPTAEALAGADPDELPMPRARGRALVGLCRALADGEVPLDRSADRADVRARLLALPGIGPWTADYVAMRALGDPDVFLPTDIGVRRALTASGRRPHAAARAAERWRPWRSYGLMHLWSTLDLRPARGTTPDTVKEN